MCKLEKPTKASPNSSTLDDGRPLIKDLLKEHATSIEKVRQKILSDEAVGKALWDPKKYDDIWILRYVLSHGGNTKHASKAALKTMKFREEFKMNEKGDLRGFIKNYGVEENSNDKTLQSLPSYDLFNAYCGKNAVIIAHPDPGRGALVYCDFGMVDCDGIVAGMTFEEYKDSYVHLNEAIYQINDEVTRRTGKLTKLTRFIELKNFSFLKFNRKYLKMDAAMQKETEEHYPQLLQTAYIFNLPSWLSAMWTVVTAFFPKRMIEKINVCPSSASTKFFEPIRKQVSEENHLVLYGGKNTEWPPPSIAETMAAAAAAAAAAAN